VSLLSFQNKYGVGISHTIQTAPVTELAAETDENLEI